MSTIQTITPLAPQVLSAPSNLPAAAGSGSVVVRTSGTIGSDVNLNISPTSRLQSERDAAIELGNRARTADTTFEHALELVKDMKTQLKAITKQFPPFATDSDERIRYLNEFSSLRKQVEALTFPPQPEAVGAWAQVQFPPERLNWDIPVLDPRASSDQAIAKAETELERINTDLTGQRESLYASVMAALGGHAETELALVQSHAVRALLAS
ncbi:MAG: hypothetical protein HGA75_10100 [Thiobacillus sp.]|nr:hypothetical protein [Thiobacillus sp.]